MFVIIYLCTILFILVITLRRSNTRKMESKPKKAPTSAQLESLRKGREKLSTMRKEAGYYDSLKQRRAERASVAKSKLHVELQAEDSGVDSTQKTTE